MSAQLATQRVWRTVDGRYVGDGHPDAVVLVAAEGDALPDDYAKHADQSMPRATTEAPTKRAVEAAAAKRRRDRVQDKALTPPSGDKAADEAADRDPLTQAGEALQEAAAKRAGSRVTGSANT